MSCPQDSGLRPVHVYVSVWRDSSLLLLVSPHSVVNPSSRLIFSLFIPPHPPHPSPNFVAYFFCALKNCLWRRLDERKRGGGRRAEEASDACPFIFLPRPPSCLTPPPPSHVVRLLIDTDFACEMETAQFYVTDSKNAMKPRQHKDLRRPREFASRSRFTTQRHPNTPTPPLKN